MRCCGFAHGLRSAWMLKPRTTANIELRRDPQSSLPVIERAAVSPAVLVVAVAWMARYFKRRDQRDRQKAEGEGRDARQRGEPSWSNPYKGEASDHFKNLAQAWDRGMTVRRNLKKLAFSPRLIDKKRSGSVATVEESSTRYRESARLLLWVFAMRLTIVHSGAGLGYSGAHSH